MLCLDYPPYLIFVNIELFKMFRKGGVFLIFNKDPPFILINILFTKRHDKAKKRKKIMTCNL